MKDKISNIKERILQLADFLQIPRSKFCVEIGSTYGNFTGKSKFTPINSDVLGYISAKYPDISAEWLLTGEGEMLKKEGEIGSNGKEEETEREQIERLSKEVGVWQTRYEELKKKRAPEAEDAGCAGAAV